MLLGMRIAALHQSAALTVMLLLPPTTAAQVDCPSPTLFQTFGTGTLGPFGSPEMASSARPVAGAFETSLDIIGAAPLTHGSMLAGTEAGSTLVPLVGGTLYPAGTLREVKCRNDADGNAIVTPLRFEMQGKAAQKARMAYPHPPSVQAAGCCGSTRHRGYATDLSAQVQQDLVITQFPDS